jgi:GAF domain-containing protein
MIQFFRSLWPTYIPDHVNREDELGVLRERILQSFILVSLVFGTVIFSLVLPTYIQTQKWVLMGVFSTALIVMVILTFFRRVPYFIRSVIVLNVIYLIGFGSLIAYGLSGNGPVLLAAFVALATILMGLWSGVISAVVTLVSMMGIGLLMSADLYPSPPISLQAISTSRLDWLDRSLAVTLIGIFFIIAMVVLINGLRRALLSQKTLTTELTQERDSLEERIQQRTQDFEKRASEMETASLIARDISQISDLDELLSKAVELIKEEYHLYYVAVFLLDDLKEYAVLRSGTGEAGKAMISINHRLRLAETSTVGFSILKKQSRLSQDVYQDPIHFKNPLLPETRSELSIPLSAGDEVIGALDVQSEISAFFTPDDVRALQISADQLAVAIEKASLVQQLTKTLNDLQMSYRQVTQQSWQGFLKATRQSYSYRYNHGELTPADQTTQQATQAISKGAPVIVQSNAADHRPFTSVAIPIKLRNQVLGVLDFRFETQKLPVDLIDMLEAAANRLALALENARLLEEIQRRAARDHMVSDISAKIRAESEINKVLQTVAGELGRSLGVSDVLIQLRGNEG